MTLFARSTRQVGGKDILLVDIGTRSNALIAVILKTATLHEWTFVKSFSEGVGDRHHFQPSLLKRLTRQWKELTFVRPAYALLLARYERARDKRLGSELKKLLDPHIDGTAKLEVFGHTQTHLDKLLVKLDPSARTSFFEHGLGDYHYIEQNGRLQGPLHALFADSFSSFLVRKGIPSDQVLPLSISVDFPSFADQQMTDLLPKGSDHHHIPFDKPLVFILLEAVDMYEVPHAFWPAYIDHVLSTLKDPARFHFLLKPHPISSEISIRATLDHCQRIGLSCSILDEPWQKSIAAEVMFAQWADRTEHVFCLFSSACFYLSQFYRNPRITYHYSTAFMNKWTSNAPPMYKRHFAALVPLIKEVFAERCKPY